MGHDAGVSTPDPSAPGAPQQRSRVVLALVWLVATVLAATVAWWAVSAVGGERGEEGSGLLSQAEVAEELADQQLAGPAGQPTGQPTDAGVSPEPTPSPTASASPEPPPGATSTPETTTAPSDPGTAAPPAPPASPASVDVARVWDVTGGQVGASCTGATITLLYATPADGWSVEVEHAGPAELEVEFVRGGEDSRLRAECVAGTPEITRSGDDDSGGDDGGGRGRGGDDD